ncbi:hypothetical protein SAMN04488589_0501 [Methanolobus vulcani]|uniref:Uncharacterized protein n=1 Tax=Methanolobus vulcani TaxID=38026 RepID=A0A7Z7AUR3_9EURY|nr:hypothetical protein [Methanolobus vulcani]SDF43249.1 hypothetical protein SAMN04488589_0501 [Methanolobus vulcani]
MRYLLPLICLILLTIPLASAGTYELENTPGFDEYIIVNSLSTEWVTTDRTVIDNDVYDNVICPSDDEIYYLEMDLTGIKEDSQLPVYFWYDSFNSTQLNFNFFYEEETVLFFWTNERLCYNLTDTLGNTYLEGEQGLGVDSCSIEITQESISLGRSDLNVSLLPAQGMTFDISSISFMSAEEKPGRGGYGYATLRVQDSDYSNDISGPLHYLYELIDFADSDRTLYQILYYMQKMLTFLLFLVEFFLSSFWVYVAVAQCGSLFWGILHKNQGVFRMIQKYIEAFGFFMKLPFILFKFFVEFVFSIANRLIPG